MPFISKGLSLAKAKGEELIARPTPLTKEVTQIGVSVILYVTIINVITIYIIYVITPTNHFLPPAQY